MCYREFGIKVVNIKPLVKRLPVLLEDRDKTVRDETKVMTVEMYRWIGAALNPQLSSLKPVQVKYVLLFHVTMRNLNYSCQEKVLKVAIQIVLGA